MAELDRGELQRNFDGFRRNLASLLPDNDGRFALLRSQAIEGLYDRAFEALADGNRRFPDGQFSVQQVTAVPEDLGFWSHAIDRR